MKNISSKAEEPTQSIYNGSRGFEIDNQATLIMCEQVLCFHVTNKSFVIEFSLPRTFLTIILWFTLYHDTEN